MFIGKQTIRIHATQKAVYKVAEQYPVFVRFFSKKSHIIKQTKGEVFVEVHAKLLGVLPSAWQGHGLKKQHSSIHFTQTHGLFQGLTAFWEFKENDVDTIASITTTFEKPALGKWFEGFLGRYVVEATTKRLLKELKFSSEKPNA